MRVGVVTFPGSLDDRDAARAVRIAGAEAVPLWHADPSLHDVDAVILPGGFSYGDYLRCGAIARFSPVMDSIVAAARDGLPVLGICNGFQVLCEAHLLPGALIRNDRREFVCRDQLLRVENASHRAGRRGYRARAGHRHPAEERRGRLRRRRAARSTSSRPRAGWSSATPSGNPNGSYRDIAGITNEAGNVVGLMPHPEHAVEALTGPGTDGLGFFLSLIGVSRMSRRHRRASPQQTPEQPQPYKELGLADDEYARVREILGRRPTSSELAIYSVMWSEHCSYKSSRVHLRQFGEKAPKTDALLVGMGENAGVVDVGDGWAVTFKIESHNHPSYVEPHQGAATGVGGIVRDILTMGARPIAVMDSLRFGPLDAPDTARVLPGVVAGIGGYGNCLGLPNIGGEVYFDESYIGNPLVNALCVGVMRADGIKLAKADGPGNQVVLFGARTGGDGIGGASVLASATFEAEGETKRPERAGRRPVRREGAHRVLPRDLRRRPRRRHPGPRRGRPVLRDHRARRGRHRRHGRRPRPRPAARPDARARRDPDERVAGTDDGRRHARAPRRVPRRLRQVGRHRHRHRRRSPTPAGCG